MTSPAPLAAATTALTSLENTFGPGAKMWHVVLAGLGIVIALALVYGAVLCCRAWLGNRYVKVAPVPADASPEARDYARAVLRESRPSWPGRVFRRYGGQESEVIELPIVQPAAASQPAATSQHAAAAAAAEEQAQAAAAAAEVLPAAAAALQQAQAALQQAAVALRQVPAAESTLGKFNRLFRRRQPN
ncbi:hypothetical protein N7474_001992 [Penicillium riverlandense]|uniref:uncharacterized protein n=1 Tax=Penicillium riverlandense TaxID=1903569 RepID=UPI002548BABE|nr:uncharacterized protein N7474_001992 [Penicillium riverlandense]KAJ5833681.1 hypothetical protein N7474_001992 [Penicillium riverlandense]